MNAYENLKERLERKIEDLSVAREQLSIAQNQPRYLAILSEIAKGNSGSASDPKWLENVQKEIDQFKTAIQVADDNVKNLVKQVQDATRLLTDYENSSPTIKAEIEAKEQQALLLKIAGISLAFIVVIGIGFYLYNKMKKTKTT